MTFYQAVKKMNYLKRKLFQELPPPMLAVATDTTTECDTVQSVLIPHDSVTELHLPPTVFDPPHQLSPPPSQ